MNEGLDSIFDTIVGNPISVGNITMIPLIEVDLTIRAGNSSIGLGANIVPKSIMIIKEEQVYTIDLK
ncbi:MAG: hypothetical protein CVU87_11160 [Firmicutes bacterium HGW-Firmicutes-12]|nr:MAG: hypothetical protein CVU87_11160 [Firmicutes bacterium HGW-Firmicutes-12]